IILFLIIGFAIMFRIHIDPRTVMTVENQIPKIIVGIILVTFSFAIVGLLIDFMWILTFLSIEVFKTIPGVNLGDSFNQVQGRNVLEVANNIMGAGRFGGLVGVAGTSSGAISSIIASIFQGPGASVIVGMILGAAGAVGGTLLVPGIGTLIGGIVGTTLGGLTGSSALGFVGGLIAFLVIVIALLFALFRLWFTLIKAYVMILIVAVFSPFWVLAGILPGSRLNFTNLLRELGSNLVTFPATIIMFLLGKTFLDIFAGSANGAPFVPPLIGNPGDYRAIGSIVGLGIILLTPDINKIMRKALQAPDFDFSAIFKSLGAGAGTVTSIASTVFATQAKTPQAGDKGGWQAFFGRFLK